MLLVGMLIASTIEHNAISYALSLTNTMHYLLLSMLMSL